MKPFRSLLYIAALLLIVVVIRPAVAANNPLNTTAASTFDVGSTAVKTETCVEGGKNLSSIHDGDYALYKAFDFDSGVAAFKVRLASIREGKLEVRLDKVDGPLMGTIAFKPTGGWQFWQDATCPVDHSQSGVRDIYLVFHGAKGPALVNISHFVFLKSIVAAGQQSVDLASRLDTDDNEPQGVRAWGMPEKGFHDDFEKNDLKNWTASGLTLTPNAIDGHHSLAATGADSAFAYTPNVYINKTDTGGEWRTLAEGSLTADISLDSRDACPGIGFASKDGKQRVYVVLNPADDSLEAYRKLADDTLVRIAVEPKLPGTPGETEPPRTWHLQVGTKYRLQLDWSPYSNGLIAFLYDDKGATLTSFRTAIDLPAARRPLLLCSGGPARFDNVTFDPTLDDWNYHWEWKKQPVLSADVCNPTVWKGKDGLLYMMWRKFGADTFHGIASSPDGIHWTRVNDEAIKCTGDMNVVVDPFGDGLLYVTGGSANMPWWTSDGANHYTTWTKTNLTTGNIFGNSRIQEIIDTKRYPQMSPIALNGKTYRFIAFTEDWNRMPKPHTVVLLSNTLTDWVQGSLDPVLPPQSTFWGEKGSAIGAAIPLPDGNILLASCSCTNAGYTGAPEPSDVSVIVDGKQPWKLLRRTILPDAPVSRESVWYQGPNFGTAYYYDADSDTLFFYGGFHDYQIGMMRVRGFLHGVGKKVARGK